MIKINKKPCPDILTPELRDELTREYASTQKPVWKIHAIETTLLESSFYKCVYCECKLSEESKYMEVDHYYNKSDYPNLVVDWDNLLPSCKRCNGHKLNYDTGVNLFINPATMDPKDHVTMRSYNYYGKTPEGKATIKRLMLNDLRKMVYPRFEIAKALQTQIEEILERAEKYRDGEITTTYNRNKIISSTTNLLYEAQRDSAFSATVATELCQNHDFNSVIRIMRDEGFWDVELDHLYQTVLKLAL